jgi:hypothetical protein
MGVQHITIYFDMAGGMMGTYTDVLREAIAKKQVTALRFHYNYSQQYRENYWWVGFQCSS